MRVYVQRASAFDRYPRAESSSVKIIGHHHHGTIVHEEGGGGSTRRGILSDVYCCCYMCVEMARDTPGSPMPRPRDLGAGGGGGAATATLTSGAYHAAAADTANMHGHALQQKILEVTYDRLAFMIYRFDISSRRRSTAERLSDGFSSETFVTFFSNEGEMTFVKLTV